MNTEISMAFEYALIARASYSNLSQSGSAASIKSQLVDDGWPDALAQYFADHYEVVVGNENSITGYDALIFKEIGTSHYILGNRGTEADPSSAFDPQDIFADVHLAITGLSLQIYSLNDFVNRHVIPILSANPAATFNVAGHSLGGYLTMWTRMLFPEEFGTGYTYNGAGVGPAATTITNKLLEEFGKGPLVVESANLVNYYTTENPEVVAATGVYGGVRQGVNVDEVAVLGHGMAPLAEALSIAYLFSLLDPDITINKVNSLLKNISLRIESCKIRSTGSH